MSREHITDTSSLDNAPAYIIHRVARVLRVHLLQFLAQAEYDITPEQWFILFRLHEQEGISQIELADQTLNDRPNITRLLHSLEKKKLVERRADPMDGRRSLVFLRPGGRKLLDRLFPGIMQERRRLFDGVSQDEVETLKEILLRIESNAQAGLSG